MQDLKLLCLISTVTVDICLLSKYCSNLSSATCSDYLINLSLYHDIVPCTTVSTKIETIYITEETKRRYLKNVSQVRLLIYRSTTQSHFQQV